MPGNMVGPMVRFQSYPCLLFLFFEICGVCRKLVNQGASGYDSVSFWLNSNPELKFGGTEIPIAKKVRFFAKLHDVNGIEFEIAPEVVKKARKKMVDKTAG